MSKPAQVSAVAMDPNHKVPVVLLKIEDDDRFVPIWIGLLEASAILVALDGVEVQRPMTHDLLCGMLSTCGASVTRVEVVDLREGTYYAELTLSIGDATTTVDARPSDALAIALRMDAPVFVHDRVLDKVQVEDGEMDAAGEGVPRDGAEIEGLPTEDPVRPTTSIGDVGAMDEEEMREMLEKLDPDDFKYRM